MVKTKTEQLDEAKTNEIALIQQLKLVENASKVFQQAYLRVTTENAILEEKIRKLEGRM
jgi:predicted nuclease with TOPRIM domain